MKPCSSRRHLTLRGTTRIADKAILNNLKVFEFESNDLTQGWVVEYAYIWCSDPRGVVTSDGQAVFNQGLATDTVSAGTRFFNASDNRFIGFLVQGSNVRNSGDFVSFQGSSFADGTRMTIDPDHIINRELYLNFYSMSDAAQAPEREWSYLIGLSPVRLTPAESVLSMVKSVAQDIDN